MLPFTLLIVGIALSVLGWFFDRAGDFDWLSRRIDPESYAARKALDDLAKSDRRALPITNPGFKPILNAWPGATPTENVAIIGRSVAFTEFGPQIANDFELVLYDPAQKEIGTRWRHAAADQAFSERFRRRTFRIGAFVFWLGITITLASGIIDLSGCRVPGA